MRYSVAMDVKQFSMLTVLVMPLTLIVIAALLGKFLPTRVLRSWPSQVLATALVLGAIGMPFAAILIDGQGDYFDDRRALLGDGLGLPHDVEIASQRGGRLG
ncbi:MAG TPA: hypothetical protein VK913_02585, partial [Erythrobacter sp.]|nr:hypothetical protein [Erythrobacter sp.]